MPSRKPLSTVIHSTDQEQSEDKAGDRAVSKSETNSHDETRSEQYLDECETALPMWPPKLHHARPRRSTRRYNPRYCYHDTRTLKDGTTVRGTQGVTFAGFTPSSRTENPGKKRATAYEYIDSESDSGASVISQAVPITSSMEIQSEWPKYPRTPLAEVLRKGKVAFSTAWHETIPPERQFPLAAELGSLDSQSPPKKSKEKVREWEDFAPALGHEIEEETFQKLVDDIFCRW